MSFWDFSLENTGRTQIVSIQYQEQYGRAKKPVFMRVFAVSSVIPILSDSVDIRFHEAGRTRGCVSPAGGHSPRKSASLSWVRVRGFPAYSVDSGERQEYSFQGFAREERLAVFWLEKPKSLTQCNQVHRLMRSLP